MNDILAKEIVYRIEGLDQVNIKKDLIYKEIDHEALLMDIYTPKELSKLEKLPAVIFIHGESSKCNNMKDTGQYLSLGRLVAASGFIGITFNHRMLLQKSNVKEIMEDINDLLAYVQRQADTLNIDKQRISIWSISAGVPFGISTLIENKTNSIRCAVLYYGFGDIESLGKFFNLDISYQDKKLLSQFSPINNNIVAPMLIARAGLDHSIINESLDKFLAQAILNNSYIDVYNHPTGQHAFDLLNDNSRTHEIIKKTIEFLKIHLSN